MDSEISNKKIVFHIQSEVQFYSLEPLLNELRRMKYHFRIAVDHFYDDKSGYNEMAVHTEKVITKAGFKVFDIADLSNDNFDLCLAPYIDGRIRADCYVKFEYGTLNIKPSLTYTPEAIGGFHAFLCQSVVTKTLLQAYGMTFPVDNLRFYNKKRKTKKDKKIRVLFAPTYNDGETEKDLVKIIQELKKEFVVIVKGHHGTQYLKSNEKKKDILKQLADEYYTSETRLSDLILGVDACLFGNSSAIAEALYVNVPCAIFAQDLDLFKIGDLHTTQYEIVRDDCVPYTNNSGQARKIIKEAISEKYVVKQRDLAERLFTKEFKTGINGYLEVIDYLLSNEDASNYVKLKNYAKKTEHDEKMRLKKIIDENNAMFEDYSKRKLYKIADKLYEIEGKIINGEN